MFATITAIIFGILCFTAGWVAHFMKIENFIRQANEMWLRLKDDKNITGDFIDGVAHAIRTIDKIN